MLKNDCSLTTAGLFTRQAIADRLQISLSLGEEEGPVPVEAGEFDDAE